MAWLSALNPVVKRFPLIRNDGVPDEIQIRGPIRVMYGNALLVQGLGTGCLLGSVHFFTLH
ncbi:hypothetical protein D3C87_1724160 [compost metagenome]